MTNLTGFLQATAFAQEQDALGTDRAQKVHHGCSVTGTHPKVDNGQACGVAGSLHGPVPAINFTIKLLSEPLNIAGAVGYFTARFSQGLTLLRGQNLSQVILGIHHQVLPLAQDSRTDFNA